MTRPWLCILIVCCLLAEAATETAATTGNKYREYSDSIRMAYVVGAIDAWGNVAEATKMMGTSYPVDVVFGDMYRCAVGRRMTQGQVLAIVDKYLKDNPAMWDFEMAGLVWSALKEACK